MARQPRYVLPGQPQHITHRGNNGAAIFFRDEDYRVYLHCLGEACAAYQCQLHAYVLMLNHVHLLVTPVRESSVSKSMQSIGGRYAQYVNSTYRRTGSLWEGRYRSTIIDPEEYLLCCMSYIELNPVRSGLVSSPREYRWSSYLCNAEGQTDLLVTAHALYARLGNTLAARQAQYRALLQTPLDERTLADIHYATVKGWVLGGSEFRERLQAVLNRRAQPLPRGGDRRSKQIRQQQTSMASDPFDFTERELPAGLDDA